MSIIRSKNIKKQGKDSAIDTIIADSPKIKSPERIKVMEQAFKIKKWITKPKNQRMVINHDRYVIKKDKNPIIIILIIKTW